MKDIIDRKRVFPFIDVSNEEWEYFSSKFEYHEFPKGSKLLAQGEIENFLTFIDEGLIRTYITFEDKDRTLRFTFPGNFVSGYASFVMQAPSQIAMETLADCKCWRASHADIQECYSRSMEGNMLGRRSAEFLYIMSSAREISMLTKTPEQQYIELLNSNPEWFQHIPLKYVASYLGITPQALSRIRGRIF